jgi:hypothetical protein
VAGLSAAGCGSMSMFSRRSALDGNQIQHMAGHSKFEENDDAKEVYSNAYVFDDRVKA